MINDLVAMGLLEDVINRTNKRYIETDDIEVLSLLNGLVNLSILEGMSFTESVDVSGISIIKLELFVDREYPEDSYFRSLNKTLLMRRAYSSIRSDKPVYRQVVDECINDTAIVDVPEPIDNVKYNIISIPPNIKKLKKKKVPFYMVTCDSFDKISPDRMATIPQYVSTLYEACGFKTFLKDKIVTNTSTSKTGRVKSFCISGANALVFTIDRIDDDVHTTWAMDMLSIESPVNGNPISIMEYIRILNPPTDDETIFNKARNQFKYNIICSSFNDVPYKRLDATDRDILDLYKRVGYKDFLNGMTVRNGDETATVTAFVINRNNKFEFRIKRSGTRSTDWVMSKCKIKLSDTSELISISEYIDITYPSNVAHKQLSMF
jgi:hypothetical protein